MTLPVKTKAPHDRLDYDVDFSRFVIDAEVLVSADVTLQDATEGSTITVDDHDTSDHRVKVWLTGGVAGDAARVRVIATTDAGRTKEVCFRIRVKDC